MQTEYLPFKAKKQLMKGCKVKTGKGCHPVKCGQGTAGSESKSTVNTFDGKFKDALTVVRRKHGNVSARGNFSYAEGVTRRSARKIARNMARTAK